MSKLPAFQFYPADWRSDNGVQSLNFFERGVWFEILCLMHESEQRGKLLLNGKAMPDEALARLLGLDKQILSKTLATLVDFGVCSRDPDGVLINRRMVNDESQRQANAARQRRFYRKRSGNEKPNAQPNANITEIQRESNSPSSSSSSDEDILNKNIKNQSRRKSSKPSVNSKAKAPPESHAQFIARLQSEFPHVDVAALFGVYRRHCKDNNIPATRRHFGFWVAKEEPPMDLPEQPPEVYVNPMTGEGFE